METFLEALLFLSSTAESCLQQPAHELEIALGEKYFEDTRFVHSYRKSGQEVFGLVALVIITIILQLHSHNKLRVCLFFGHGLRNILYWLIIVYAQNSLDNLSPYVYLVYRIFGEVLGSPMLHQYLLLEMVVNNFTGIGIVHIFFRQKIAKFSSKLLVQILVPLVGTENDQLWYLGGLSILLYNFGVILFVLYMINEEDDLSKYESSVLKQETEEKITHLMTKSNHHLKHKHYGYYYQEVTVTIRRIIHEFISQILPTLLVFCAYWAQSGEFFYTYLFLKSCGLTPQELRLCDGLQYVGFAVILQILSYRRENGEMLISPRVILLGGLIVSLVSRFLQILAFYDHSFAIWIASATLSIMSPGAGEVLRKAVYQKGEDSHTGYPTPCIGLVLIVSRQITTGAMTWVYWWAPCPFIVTFFLILFTLVGSCLLRLGDFNKKY